MHITDIIIRADAQAIAAASEAAPVTVLAHDIEQVLSTLPLKAFIQKRQNPNAASFLFDEWDPLDAAQSALGEALTKALKDIGFAPKVIVGDLGLPRAIMLSYEDLHAVAELEIDRRNAWIDTAGSIWKKKGGKGASVEVVPQGAVESVLRFATEAEIAPTAGYYAGKTRKGGQYVSQPSWAQQSAEEVVAKAIEDLRPVLWTDDEVDRLWKERGGTSVTRGFGLYEGASVEHLATVIFTVGDKSKTYGVSYVHDLSAQDLVSRAAEDLGMAKGGNKRAQHAQK